MAPLDSIEDPDRVAFALRFFAELREAGPLYIPLADIKPEWWVAFADLAAANLARAMFSSTRPGVLIGTTAQWKERRAATLADEQ